MANRKWIDPVVEEVREAGEAILRECDNDLEKLTAKLIEVKNGTTTGCW